MVTADTSERDLVAQAKQQGVIQGRISRWVEDELGV
jgi:hypothetical protein